MIPVQLDAQVKWASSTEAHMLGKAEGPHDQQSKQLQLG